MARIYREAPLNSVWEGTANMMCMDVRRAISRNPDVRPALMAEFEDVRGENRQFDHFLGTLSPLLDAIAADEYSARAVTEALARAIQGALLIRHSTGDVVDAFVATRLGSGTWGTLLGTLPAGIRQAQADAIVARAQVVRR